MINTLSTSFTIIVYFMAFTVFFLLLSIILTRKFNYKLKQFYSIFFGLSFREIVLQACIIIHFLLGLYFLYDIKSFNPIGIVMLITINIISFIIAFDLYTILTYLIYGIISIGLLWLLNIVVNYYEYMQDNVVYYLLIIFSILIFIYMIFITIRKIGILLKKHKRLNMKG